jgi:uncharacterized Zn finger protein
MCGKETPHRILHVEPSRPDGAFEGVARCQECRWTHRFRSVERPMVAVRAVYSEGARSEARTLRLPAGTRLAAGRPLPRPEESGDLVRRIDGPGGRALREAQVEEVATLWLSPDPGRSIAVSIVEGRTTRAVRWRSRPEEPVPVGGTLTIDGQELRVVGIRARGRTWKVPGDAFLPAEIVRVYARRTLSPPEGRSAWRRERESPSSRASSISRSARSRSSPGVRR